MTEGGVLDDDGGRSCCCCCCCCFTSSSVRPPLLAHPDFLCALFRSRRPPPGRRTIARRTKTGRPVARRRRRRGRTRWRRRRRFDRPCVRASTGRLLQAPCDVREAGYPRCVAVVSFPKPRSDCRHVRGKALQRRDAVRRSGASSRVLGLKRRAGVSHGLGSSRNVSAPSLKLLTATVAPLRETDPSHEHLLFCCHLTTNLFGESDGILRGRRGTSVVLRATLLRLSPLPLTRPASPRLHEAYHRRTSSRFCRRAE